MFAHHLVLGLALNLTFIRVIKKLPKFLRKLGLTTAAQSAQIYYQNCLIQYLFQQNSSLLKRLNTKNIKTQPSNTIWVCWLQGYENAPTLVKKCIDQLKYHHDNVVLIDLNNYMTYVDIPQFIIEKFQSKIITPTHFSDILRFALMSQHGGIWIDSTYLILDKLPNTIFESNFFTLSSKLDFFKQWIPEGKWSGNFMKFNKDDPTPSIIFQCFINYWQKNNHLIDYFLIDFIIKVNYLHNPRFNSQINQTLPMADQIFLMSEILLIPISQENDLRIAQDPLQIYKLSYRVDATPDNINGTYYEKYILSK